MKKKIIIASIVAVVVVVDLFVLLYHTISNRINTHRQSRVIMRYIDDVAAMDDGNAKAILDAARAYNLDLLENVTRFRPTAEETLHYKGLLNTGREVMGILVIDKLDIKLPIYHGTDEGVLQVGLGHMQGTSLPVGGVGTHAFITGHRGLPSSKLLTNLDKMAEGDTFVLYVLSETMTYQVDFIQTVEPHVVEALDIDPDMDCCTLVTCTPYGVNTHRLLVRGRRVENAANTGWEAIHADARRLDKLLIIALFMIPASPVILLSAAAACVKIHKKGKLKP